MTDSQRPLKVFLCHAHSDKNAVRDLYQRLTQDGVDAWLDKEKLLPGQDWELEIRKAVREADVVVVCLSKQFNQAGFRQKEVRLALDTAMEQLDGEIFIIPARLEECDVPERLQRYHWVDLFEEDGYEILLRALQARADRIGAAVQVEKDRLPGIIEPRRSEALVEQKPERRQKPFQVDNSKPGKIRTGKAVSPRKPNTAIIVAVIGFVGMICAALISSPMIENLMARTLEPTATISIPADTETPTMVPTPVRTFTALPYPAEINDHDVPMLLVAAGGFTMGNENGDSNEKPAHQVYIDAFYMDKYEVTNAAYKTCVDAGGCTPPQKTSSYTHSSYYGNLEFQKYPVIYVDWNQSSAYCEWRGGSLPTEAQWEKAARGSDGYTYPWDGGIDCNKANYWGEDGGCVGDLAKVGSYEDGRSPYGIYDLAGNVWEWTADWYSETYYQNSPPVNPLGLDWGRYRVLRGGGWGEYGDTLRTSIRYSAMPDVINYNLGFRCTKSVVPK